MLLIKADPERRIEIPGVPGPVQRPVDIDRSRTGFTSLRSLRIYKFDAGAVIDGHAEEDEVFVVVLAGTVEFAATGAPPEQQASNHQLSAPGKLQSASCVAYLPPQAAYRLEAKTDSVVAYARATPSGGNSPASFQASRLTDEMQVKILLEEKTYAQRLHLCLFYINASVDAVDLKPIRESEVHREALVHIHVATSGGASAASIAEPGSLSVESWDTLAISPGEQPTLRFERGSSALALVISAG